MLHGRGQATGIPFNAPAVDASRTDTFYALRSVIAYSATDEGERPFGDTASAAMFDDAGDLGRALDHATATSQSLKDSTAVLAKALVQYAGKPALGDAEGGAGSGYASEILDLAHGGLTLAEDFSADRWSHGPAHTSIIGRNELMTKALATLGGFGGGYSDLSAGMAWLFPTSGTSAIDRVEFATTNVVVVWTLPSSGGVGTTASLVVGSDCGQTLNDNHANERTAA